MSRTYYLKWPKLLTGQSIIGGYFYNEGYSF